MFIHYCNGKSMPNVENYVLSLHTQPKFVEFILEKLFTPNLITIIVFTFGLFALFFAPYKTPAIVRNSLIEARHISVMREVCARKKLVTPAELEFETRLVPREVISY